MWRIQGYFAGFCILSTANEVIKRELQKEELDTKLYGVHSLRAGGASAAAALGVPDRLFQRQGGWRSERSKNNYIQESMESLLTVTKTIQAWELIRHLWLNFHLVHIYQTLSDPVLGWTFSMNCVQTKSSMIPNSFFPFRCNSVGLFILCSCYAMVVFLVLGLW